MAHNTARYRATRKALISDYKVERGCLDCGFDSHPEALDFDHRPSTEKKFNIGNRGWTVSEATLLAEIEKCDVLCANCHRIRTADRRKGVTGGDPQDSVDVDNLVVWNRGPRKNCQPAPRLSERVTS